MKVNVSNKLVPKADIVFSTADHNPRLFVKAFIFGQIPWIKHLRLAQLEPDFGRYLEILMGNFGKNQKYVEVFFSRNVISLHGKFDGSELGLEMVEAN